MEFLVLLIPIAWLVFSKFWLRNTITVMETIIGIVLILSAAAALYHFGVMSKIEDFEVWNGKVTSKAQVQVSCWHSYDCFCDDNGSSCSTCYEHDNDWAWMLYTTAGDIAIKEIDRRGIQMPPIWKKAYVDEPVSIIKQYSNYIQAVPSSVFDDVINEDFSRFDHLIPDYPLDLKDEYHYQHVRALGTDVAELSKWNTMLAEVLKDLGPEKQVNVLVLFVATEDDRYLQALEKAWLKGNKNDVIVVISTTEFQKMNWVGIITWSPVVEFKVQLQEKIQAVGKIDPNLIIPLIQQQILDSFERLHMQDYSHLKDQIKPSDDILWVILGVLLIGPILYTFLAHKFNTTSILMIPLNLVFLLAVGFAIDYFGFFIAIGFIAIAIIALIIFFVKKRNTSK